MSANPNPFASSQPTSQGGASPFTNRAANAVDPNATTAAAGLEQQTIAAAPLEPMPSLDDPSLTSETLTAKEGDAYAVPPPPAEGIYRVKLSLRGVKIEDAGGVDISDAIRKYPVGSDGATAAWIAAIQKDFKTGATVGSFAKTIMDVRITDTRFPELDGVFLQVPFKWVDTKKGKSGVSKVETIMQCSRQPSGQPWLVTGQNYSHLLIINTFTKFLLGEPEVKALCQWQWGCEECGKQAKAAGRDYPKGVDGMHNFPPAGGGKFKPERQCQAVPAHGFSKARAVAIQFFSLEYKG